jgi:hypothetical protein
VQVEAEIISQVVALENVFQQALVTWPKQHHVVRHIFVPLVGTKVPNEQTHRIFAGLNFGIAPDLAVFGVDQVLVSLGGIGITDNNICRQCLTIGHRHARGATIGYFDASDFSASAQTAPP